MSRSTKKGPFVDDKLVLKIQKQKESNGREAIKTWSRSSTVLPDFVGHNFSIHDGRKFVSVFITESMVGHKLGEFAPTRTYHSHSK